MVKKIGLVLRKRLLEFKDIEELVWLVIKVSDLNLFDLILQKVNTSF